MSGVRILQALVIVAILCVGIVPLAGIVTYTYGGQYYKETYPLQQASQWLITAQGSAGQAPAYANTPQDLAVLVESQTSRAWAFLNTSQANAGVGTGSPCWFFAQPQQTYLYSQLILQETYTYLANLTRDNTTFFTNSQWMANFGEVGTQLGNVNGAIVGVGGKTIESCIFQGERTWFEWFFGDIGLAGAIVGYAVVTKWLESREQFYD